MCILEGNVWKLIFSLHHMCEIFSPQIPEVVSGSSEDH